MICTLCHPQAAAELCGNSGGELSQAGWLLGSTANRRVPFSSCGRALQTEQLLKRPYLEPGGGRPGAMPRCCRRTSKRTRS